MSKKSLVQHFKKNPILRTDVGEFTFSKSIGQGGNAFVLEFTKGKQSFAIKFIQHEDEQKIRRFIDEFFCAATIPSHPNIAQSYHFDSIKIEDLSYSIIVMKRYGSSLHEIGAITSEPEEVLVAKAEKLLNDLCNGLRHLHTHKIVHRDIKPQNILFDENLEKFVITDLGIAHFNEELFAKATQTKSTDRLANYLFSAPEQANSKIPPAPTNDIYALGQVMQWYLTGKPIKGLGRDRFHAKASLRLLQLLDGIVDKSLNDNPERRFQSIDEIYDFIQEEKSPKRPNFWPAIHWLDKCIRKSFTKIREIEETDDPAKIEKFIKSLQEGSSEKYWYVTADGGDNTYSGMERLANGFWLFDEAYEINISKLIVYRNDASIYKNFFILLIAPAEPFKFTDHQGKIVERNADLSTWSRDFGIHYECRYIDPNETENDYYSIGEETIAVSADKFKERIRQLKTYAFLIVPLGTASSRMPDRDPGENILKSVINDSHLVETTLKKYLDATRAHHSNDITMWT